MSRFKTVGIEAGIEHRVLDAIQGHRPRNVAEGYGEVTIKAQAAAIAKLPRYEFSRNLNDWNSIFIIKDCLPGIGLTWRHRVTGAWDYFKGGNLGLSPELDRIGRI